jgi:hypothetical protein
VVNAFQEENDKLAIAQHTARDTEGENANDMVDLRNRFWIEMVSVVPSYTLFSYPIHLLWKWFWRREIGIEITFPVSYSPMVQELTF